MSPATRRILVALAVFALSVAATAVLYRLLGSAGLLGGAAASAVAVDRARRIVRSERRSAGRRQREEVREVAQLQERDRVVTAPAPDSSDEQERIRRITDRAADRRRRSRTGQAP